MFWWEKINQQKMSHCSYSQCWHHQRPLSVSVLWSVMDSALKTPLGCALSPTLIWQFPIDNRNECTFVTLHNNCMPLILLRSACRHFCKTLVKELALLSYSLSADRILWGHRWNVECCSAFHTNQWSTGSKGSTEELDGKHAPSSEEFLEESSCLVYLFPLVKT